MKTIRFGTPGLAAAAAALLLSCALAPAAPAAPGKPAAPKSERAPFARVSLALKGCTSCSHCRTTIRQMVKSNAKGGATRVRDDKVEVRYESARPVPLRRVIRSLADNRLHDLAVVDVLFEASGVIAPGPDGRARFTIAETGQSFPIAVGDALRLPSREGPVRLIAVVEGWREDGELSLVAREVKGGA